MATDPLRYFDQQFESHELLHLHRERLIAEAREVLRKQPHAAIAGLVLTRDAGDFAELGMDYLQATGARELPAEGFVGLVPLALVAPILDRLAQHLPPVPAGPGQVRLPVLVSTRDGRRFGMFVFDPEGDD